MKLPFWWVLVCVAGLAGVGMRGAAIGFEVADRSVPEGAAVAEVEIFRLGDASSAVKVRLLATPGTASPGVDYLAPHGELTFPGGVTNRIVTIPLLDDGEVEPEETVIVSVRSLPGEPPLEGRTEGVLTLLDDELAVGVDPGFVPQIPAGAWVQDFAIAPDGRIVLVGSFWEAGHSNRPVIIRLHADGSRDGTFASEVKDPATPYQVETTWDGRVLVSCRLSSGYQQSDPILVRLTADGSVDPTFQLERPLFLESFGVQPDGKILVWLQTADPGSAGGDREFARLLPEGSLDTDFKGRQSVASLLQGGWPDGFQVLPEGRILVAIERYEGGSAWKEFFRLNPDGTLDARFALRSGQGLSLVAAFADGSLLANEWVELPGLGGRCRLSRLRPDGAWDPVFAPEVLNGGEFGCIRGTAIRPDDRVWVVGSFTEVNRVPRCGIALLLPDGNVDPRARGPDCGGKLTLGDADGRLGRIRAQADGAVVVAGTFDTLGGYPRPGLARVLDRMDVAGGPEFANGVIQLTESASEVVLPLRRTGDSSLEVRARVRTVDGSARAGEDYLAAGGDVVFGPLETVGELRVPLLNDGRVEGEEHFQVLLEPAAPGASFGHLPAIEVRLVDNDFGISFVEPSTTVREGVAEVGIPVTRRGDDRRAVEVRCLVRGGTATPGVDTEPMPASVTFEEGAMESSLLIRVRDDGVFEGDEVLNLELQDPANLGILGVSTGTILLIADNERPGIRLNVDYEPSWQGSTIPSAGGRYGVSQVLVPGDRRLIIGTWARASEAEDWRYRILRLGLDGREDPGFQAVDGTTALLALDREGRILAATPDGLGRYRDDGLRDAGFRVGLGGEGGVTPWVYEVHVQADGKLLVVGSFGSVNGVGRTNVVRLHPDGSVDADFHATELSDGSLDGAALIPGGGYYVAFSRGLDSGGPWTPPTAEVQIRRWAADGGVDPAFAWKSPPQTGLRLQGPAGLRVQPDGRLLVNLAWGARYWMAGSLFRIHPDGTDDTTFSVREADGAPFQQRVPAWDLLPDGRLLAWFRLSAMQSQAVFRRLERDGAVDRTFQFSQGPDAAILGFTVLNDTTGVVWGDFAAFDGVPRPGLAVVSLSAVPAAGVRFSSGTTGAPERAEHARMAVHRLGNSEGRMVVDYGTSGGTAQPGMEYFPRVGHLVFEPYQTSALLEIPLPDNPWPDFDTAFEVSLTCADPGVVVAPPGSESSVRVLDDDRPGGITATFVGGSPQAEGAEEVTAVLVQPDGRVVAAILRGDEAFGLRRFLPGGVEDPAFHPLIEPAWADQIHALGWQSDGRILLGGDFASVRGASRTNLARLNPDGSLDESYNPAAAAWATSPVMQLAVLPDDRLLVSGMVFLAASGGRRGGVVRLFPDGRLDESFEVRFAGLESLDAIVALPDHRIYVGGRFTGVEDWVRTDLVRLNHDGSVDVTFDASASGINWVKRLVPDPTGRILVGHPGGTGMGSVTRLLVSGRVDGAFDPPPDTAELIGVQQDGRVVVKRRLMEGQYFRRWDVGRLHADGRADPTYCGPEDVGDCWMQRDQVFCAFRGAALARAPAPLVLLKSVDPPPAFRSIGHATNTAVLTLHGLPGRRHVVEASSDLRRWDALRVISPSTNPPAFRIEVVDADEIPFGHRFYRAEALAP